MSIVVTSPWNAGSSRISGTALQRIRGPLLVQFTPPVIAVATCMLIIFSAVDAAMTMTLLPLGAVECNPLMRELIERDPSLFLHSKLLITATSALTLAVLSVMAPARQMVIACALQGLVALYVALIGYEIFLARALT